MANTMIVSPGFHQRLLPEGRVCHRDRCQQPIEVGQRVYWVGFDQVYHVAAECSDPLSRPFASVDPEIHGRGVPAADLPADAWGEND